MNGQSRAILSNLTYQFFGKVNAPNTAKYYEQFFEIIKKETTNVNRGYNLEFDTRVTTGEKEVSKIRADVFFRLKEGEFITYVDGKDKKVHFKQPIKKNYPKRNGFPTKNWRKILPEFTQKQNQFFGKRSHHRSALDTQISEILKIAYKIPTVFFSQ